MKPGEIEGTPKKELCIVYVLDTSGSMGGAPIEALNDAMTATVSELKNIAAKSAEATFKIAVLEYNSGANWVTVNSNGEPISQYMEDYDWTPLSAGGITALGAALDTLNDNLSREKILKSSTGNKAPILIFMSDGFPNDKWENSLAKISSENKLYQQAIKIAFALGEEADASVLAKVVGTPEAVLRTNNLETFKKMIRVVSLTSSVVHGRSKPTSSAKDDTKKIIDEAVGSENVGKGEDGTTVVPDPSGNDDGIIFLPNPNGEDTGADPAFSPENLN